MGAIRSLEAECTPVGQRSWFRGRAKDLLRILIALCPQLQNHSRMRQDWALSCLAHARITLVQRPKSPSWPYMKRNTAVLILALRCTLHKLPNYTFRLRSETPGGKKKLHGQLSAASNGHLFGNYHLFGLSHPSTKARDWKIDGHEKSDKSHITMNSR